MNQYHLVLFSENSHSLGIHLLHAFPLHFMFGDMIQYRPMIICAMHFDKYYCIDLVTLRVETIQIIQLQPANTRKSTCSTWE